MRDQDHLIDINASQNSRQVYMARDPTSPSQGQYKEEADGDINVMETKGMLSPGAMHRKNIFQRTFRKMDKGSLRGSIFALCSSAIGSGVMSLPYVLRQSGMALGLGLIVLGAISALWSLNMIIDTSVQHNIKNFTDLAERSGGKHLRRLLEVILLIYLFGACVSFQIIIASLIRFECVQFGVDPDFGNSWQFRAMVNGPIALLFLFPLNSIKDMSGFRYVSMVSMASLLYMGLVLVIEMPMYAAYYLDPNNPKPRKIVWFIFDINFFTSAATTFFAYTCQIQLLPIYSELAYPDERRIKKVVRRSIIVDFGFYFTIAFCGYMSTFQETQPIVLERPPLPIWKEKYDIFMVIAIVAIVLVIFVSEPVNYNPFRNQIVYMRSN